MIYYAMFLDLLKFESEELQQAFRKASKAGRGTPQEISDFRENHFNVFIGRYFPYPYRVAKGIIRDSFGESSHSIDTVLLNPIHPNLVDQTGKFTLILADGVDLAIELKPNLSHYDELKRSLKQTASLKKLRRARGPIVSLASHSSEKVAHSRMIPAFIFTLIANPDYRKTWDNIQKAAHEEGLDSGTCFDFIVIYNKGIIVNYPTAELSRVQEAGTFFEEWNEFTLAGFIKHMNGVYHAQPMFSKPILEYYTNELCPKNIYKLT